MGYLHKNKLLTTLKFKENFALSESDTGHVYKYLRKYKVGHSSSNINRLYMSFSRVDDTIVSYKRIHRTYDGKITSTWFKCEIDEAGNMITYEDSQGHYWKEDWDVEFLHDAMPTRAFSSYKKFKKWYDSQIKTLTKYS
jgi:hypothetical protein